MERHFFQPSEFMKISYILMLARAIVRFTQKTQGMETDYSLGFPTDWLDDRLYHTSLDPLSPTKWLGDCLGLCSYFFRYGSPFRCFVEDHHSGFATGVTAVVGFMAIFISKDGRAFLHQIGMPTYQINRILAWLNPFDFAQTTTYQQAQGQIAIGSGGLFGQGFNVQSPHSSTRERYDFHRNCWRLWLYWFGLCGCPVLASYLSDVEDYT